MKYIIYISYKKDNVQAKGEIQRPYAVQTTI